MMFNDKVYMATIRLEKYRGTETFTYKLQSPQCTSMHVKVHACKKKEIGENEKLDLLQLPHLTQDRPCTRDPD